MGPGHLQPEFSAESAGKLATQPTPAETGWRTWPTPIRDRHWIDAQGKEWRIRGGLLTARQARQLFRRPDVVILHVYGPDPRQLTGPERDALIERIEQFLADAAPPTTDFAIAEFRNDQRQAMLVVQESC
jgi:hypothetical protein